MYLSALSIMCVCVRAYVRTWVCTYDVRTYVSMYVCMDVCVYVYVCILLRQRLLLLHNAPRGGRNQRKRQTPNVAHWSLTVAQC